MTTASHPPSPPALAPELDAEEARRRIESRFHFLAESIPVQIWTARPDGNLDYVTEQTARQFGLSPERLLRDGWLDVLHPEDVPRAVERWTHALQTGDTYEVEFRLRLPDGTYAWHLARAVAQKDAAGAVVAWFGTNTNIEDQREQHRRTEALLEEVASQARETAAQLLALRTAKAQAERRIQELEALLGLR